MDPFGLCSIITALLSTGSAICTGLSDIKDAQKVIHNVKNEVHHVQGLLRNLSLLINEPNSPLSYIPHDIQREFAENLRSLMEVKLQLSNALGEHLASGVDQWFSSLISRLKWVFKNERDVDKLRRNLESHKGTIMLTLMTMQSLGIGRVILMHERAQQAANDKSCNDFQTQSRSVGFGLHKNEFELPQEIQQTFQIQTWGFEAPSDPEQQEKTQRYMVSLAHFISSGKFQETLAEVRERRAMSGVRIQYTQQFSGEYNFYPGGYSASWSPPESLCASPSGSAPTFSPMQWGPSPIPSPPRTPPRVPEFYPRRSQTQYNYPQAGPPRANTVSNDGRDWYPQPWQHSPYNSVKHEQNSVPDPYYAPPPQPWESDNSPPAGSYNYTSPSDYSPVQSPVQAGFNNQWDNTCSYQNQMPPWGGPPNQMPPWGGPQNQMPPWSEVQNQIPPWGGQGPHHYPLTNPDFIYQNLPPAWTAV